MSSPNLPLPLRASRSSATSQDQQQQQQQQPDINAEVAGAGRSPAADVGNNDSGDEDTSYAERDENGVGDGYLPMSMTASVILTNLPKDSSAALKEVEELDERKVSIRFQPVGSAPILKQRVFKISASSKFSVVLNFLRKKLGVKDGDGLFLYVNSVFAPGLDEGVGNLFRCFKTDDQLIVSYSTTPAFG
ncbi:Ubiquitin-like protein [Exophiala xenobiotica]|nr:Ubiquitin-like protein [Exophiala xenobiotica]KAK5248783.1 Ubiquitin-like protein [Exophiala xenobiotica]KAK5347352.1 Ubiquitin-like protein [Exophiala xenobiotica]KAK5363717.1 Ubiquitin-like protein [Exophiala xenobiotica]KAK5365082.1 Ubiquitin-like protein [Exophiala xenobiotica]